MSSTTKLVKIISSLPYRTNVKQNKERTTIARLRLTKIGANKLYLELDNVKIEEKHLLNIVRDVESKDLLFEGRAIEQEGKKISEDLQKLKNEIVEVKFQTRDSFVINTGIFKVKEIDTSHSETEAPAIYRFSGRLEIVK